MTVTAIRTRMYNVGFGDAFLLTLEHTRGSWRMLVDCGVHPGGGSDHKISQIVEHIIADITTDNDAHLDVVVATHRHRDHVSGFQDARWDNVTVDEVWLPFTENPDDDLGASIKREQARKVQHLQAHLALRLAAGDRGAERAARVLENDFTNAEAMERLHDGFAGSPRRRYFPNPGREPESFAIRGPGDVHVHMLGPRHDRDVIAAMDPPADQQWLRLLDQLGDTEPTARHLFTPAFEMTPEAVRVAHSSMYLDETDREALVVDTAVDTLAAASSIAGATNNTSLVFVLEVADTKLLFPGDAQWGLWDAILQERRNQQLLTDIQLYKVGHHGSHNATHTRFVHDLMGDHTISMMSFHPVEDWPSIPNPWLVRALEQSTRMLVRSDQPKHQPDVHWTDTVVAEYTLAL
jgi:beta-lactamase superfamily II metal-dependent hydrolase